MIKTPRKTTTKPAATGATPMGTQAPTELLPTEPLPGEANITATTPIAVGTPSKQDIVVIMLRRDDGASITEIMAATKWQAHSVRGFLSGTVKKKLGLAMTRTKDADGQQRYRIVEPASETIQQTVAMTKADSSELTSVQDEEKAAIESPDGDNGKLDERMKPSNETPDATAIRSAEA